MGNLTSSCLPWNAPPTVSRTTMLEMSTTIDDGRIFSRPMANIKSVYNFGSDSIGEGQFGTVHAVSHKGTGRRFACKTISKLDPDNATREEIRREVEIMHHLSGHPNVVDLHEVFEDKNEVHLVMELCEGGDLTKRTFERKRYHEEAAKKLFRQVVEAISYCHDMGVIHRDVKMDSFVFLTEEEDSPLKAIDFGLSTFFRPGQKFEDRLGTLLFISPEAAEAQPYGPETDIWSAGVILYILLSGTYPYHAVTLSGLREIIRKGNYLDFSNRHWSSISNGAKDLIARMLQPDPELRISTAKILNHPWVGQAGDAIMDLTVLKRMKQFPSMNRFKRVALKVIAENLSEEETKGLRNVFESIADNSGQITSEGLKIGVSKWGSYLFDSEVNLLMDSVDLDGDGVINCTEFISASMHANRITREERLRDVFQHFDKDNSGYLTTEDIRHALVQYCMADNWICCLLIKKIMIYKEAREIFAKVDNDKDGNINYDEFVNMMLGNNMASQSYCN